MKSKKAITIVNSITMIRVIGTFLMPFFAIILTPVGLIIYITCLLLTDALDGFLARTLNACTIFGSLLDQAADKLGASTRNVNAAANITGLIANYLACDDGGGPLAVDTTAGVIAISAGDGDAI